MDDIEARFRKEPSCRVVSAGKWDGYKTDLAKLIRANRLPKVAVIGHSMAGMPIIELIAEYRELIDYAALLDPVGPFGVGECEMPDNPPLYWWARRSKIGGEVLIGLEVPLRITNANGPQIIEGGHNDLPHKAEVIERLARDILG